MSGAAGWVMFGLTVLAWVLLLVQNKLWMESIQEWKASVEHSGQVFAAGQAVAKDVLLIQSPDADAIVGRYLDRLEQLYPAPDLTHTEGGLK